MLRIIFFSFFVSVVASTNDGSHILGIEYSVSNINNEFDGVTADLNDVSTSHFSPSYQYELVQNISIGVAYLKGDSSNVTGLVDIFTDTKIDYRVILLSANGRYPISLRNYLYIKANVLQYDFDIVDDKQVVYNEEGNDYSLSVGWMYEFDNGVVIKAGYEKINLGENIDIQGFNSGISYRF